MSRALLKELECPVCLQYLFPPFLLCSNGHCICRECRQKIDACPTCRARFTDTRCVVLENIIRGLMYPCAFSKAGCKEVLSLQFLGEHEAVCPEGTHNCPLNKFLPQRCFWEGKWKDFKSHVRQRHIDISACTKPTFSPRFLSINIAVIFAFGEVFFYIKRQQSDKYYFYVTVLGTNDKAHKYKCSYSLNSENEVDRIVKCHFVQNFSEEFENIVTSYKCLRLDDQEITNYYYGNEFHMQIEISALHD